MDKLDRKILELLQQNGARRDIADRVGLSKRLLAGSEASEEGVSKQIVGPARCAHTDSTRVRDAEDGNTTRRGSINSWASARHPRSPNTG